MEETKVVSNYDPKTVFKYHPDPKRALVDQKKAPKNSKNRSKLERRTFENLVNICRP